MHAGEVLCHQGLHFGGFQVVDAGGKRHEVNVTPPGFVVLTSPEVRFVVQAFPRQLSSARSSPADVESVVQVNDRRLEASRKGARQALAMIARTGTKSRRRGGPTVISPQPAARHEHRPHG